MTTAKELLEQATPLPWQVHRVDWDAAFPWHVEAQNGGTVAAIHWRVRDEGEPDAALIVYAVNRLPDYEAAVDALEYMAQAFSGRAHGDAPHNPDPDTGGDCKGCVVLQEDAYERSRAALARLRGAS